jgi:hypothetical protein
MSKMHFIRLAALLRGLKPATAKTSASYKQWDETVYAIAGLCGSFNPRFDRTRFVDACGVER